MKRRSVGLAVLALLPLLAAPALAQTPVGGEFQVNSFATGTQRYPSIGVQPSGDYVVVWQGDAGNVTADAGIFGRRYSSSGAAIGSEFEVGSFFKGFDERKPSVAVSGSSGNFAVSWHIVSENGSDTEVIARRFSSSGAPLGNDFLVNTFTTNKQLRSSAGMADDGSFVVAWMSYGAHDGSGIGIFAQRYSSSGAQLGAEFQVNTWTTTGQLQPALAVAPSGDFIVAWEDNNQEGSSSGVFGQRYASSGATLGGEFRVNSYTTGKQYRAAVDANDAGFVIAWDSKGQDGDQNGVFAQRYASDGTTLGGEWQVNTNGNGQQTRPAVAFDPSGDFTIAWDSAGEIRAQRYASDGSAQGASFQVNTTTADRQYDAGIGNGGDDFLVVWDSFGQDQAGDWGVFGQRFATLLDYGDAPDPTYPTLQASNGAAHVQPSALYLGLSVDDDPDGQPTVTADGDDVDGNDDEDGVTFTSVLVPGAMASVDVTSSASGFLNAWVDFNQDGDWADAGEAIFTDEAVGAGTNSLSFAVPGAATQGPAVARFRVSSAGGDSYDGVAADGEVEDHPATVAAAGAIAQMISPVPATTFSSSSVTFLWSPGTGVTEYWLQVGTSKPGGREIFNASTGTNQTQTVTGIPGGSSTIYVRLWSRIGGVWFRIDYTYTSFSGLATLTAPSSPLTSTTETFTWTAGAGSKYWLQVGTTGVGSRELFNGAVAGTSQAVSGLPTGSVNVYIRLWTFINGSWRGPSGQYIQDYVYVSAP